MNQSTDIQELIGRKEELHRDLSPFVNLKGSFPTLRHPFVYSVPYTPGMNAFLNRQYLVRKREIEKAKAEGDFTGYVMLHERPYRVMMLILSVSQ